MAAHPSPPYAVRCGLGLLLWMGSWWLVRPVHLAVTGLLPLALAAVFGFVRMGDILPSYADELIILLLGANILTTAWQRWGLDRRIALLALAAFGPGARRQLIAWFLVSTALATLLPRVVVAATMIPIVVAMLRFMGVEDLWNSRLGTSLVLAVAWGSSLGGFLTPLGGAPNLLAMKFVQDMVTHHEFLFTTWVTRLAPLTIGRRCGTALYMAAVFDSEVADNDRPRVYFFEELRALGPMTGAERVALLGCSSSRPFWPSPAASTADCCRRSRPRTPSSRWASWRSPSARQRTAGHVGVRAEQDDVGAVLRLRGRQRARGRAEHDRRRAVSRPPHRAVCRARTASSPPSSSAP